MSFSGRFFPWSNPRPKALHCRQWEHQHRKDSVRKPHKQFTIIIIIISRQSYPFPSSNQDQICHVCGVCGLFRSCSIHLTCREDEVVGRVLDCANWIPAGVSPGCQGKKGFPGLPHGFIKLSLISGQNPCTNVKCSVSTWRKRWLWVTLVFGAGLWSPSWTTWKALATSKHTHTHLVYVEGDKKWYETRGEKCRDLRKYAWDHTLRAESELFRNMKPKNWKNKPIPRN